MGEPDAADFEVTFHDLYPRARSLAYRILGDPAEAEDAAAEAFSRALLAWRRLSGLPYLNAWVLRVTTNVAVDVARRRRGPQPAPVVEAVDGADEVVVLRMALTAALAALPRRQREVIALRHLVGMPEADVARSLGLSIGSVKRHAHRGLAGLRRRLGSDWDWPEVRHVAL